MKNKTLIVITIISLLFLMHKSFSQEIDLQAKDIEFSDDQNLTIANDATAIIKKDGIIIKGKKIEYFRDKSFLLIKNGKISSTDESFKISSEIIEYKIDQSNLILIKNVKLKDNVNNLIMESDKIEYDLRRRKIISQSLSEIIDEFNNIYKVKSFEYFIDKKIIKLDNLFALDDNKNSFLVDLAYLDLNKKELIAKDISMNFNYTKQKRT